MQRTNEWYLNAMSNKQAYMDAMTNADSAYTEAKNALAQAQGKDVEALTAAVEAARSDVRQSIVDCIDAECTNENFEGHAIFVSNGSLTGRCHIGSPVTGRDAYVKLIDRARVGSAWMVDGYVSGKILSHFGVEDNNWTQQQAVLFAKRWVTETS